MKDKQQLQSDVIEAMLGHSRGLVKIYDRYEPGELLKAYSSAEQNLRVFVEEVESPETTSRIEQLERIIRSQEARIKLLDEAMRRNIVDDLEAHPECKPAWKGLIQ